MNIRAQQIHNCEKLISVLREMDNGNGHEYRHEYWDECALGQAAKAHIGGLRFEFDSTFSLPEKGKPDHREKVGAKEACKRLFGLHSYKYVFGPHPYLRWSRLDDLHRDIINMENQLAFLKSWTYPLIRPK